jgi:hypothetical protein
MTGEELDKQIQEVSEKLKKRDDADQKKAEKEFRAKMAKDTAGHVMDSFRVVAAQLQDLQTQIDATNPMAPIIRVVGELSVKLTEIEARVVALESGKNAE